MRDTPPPQLFIVFVEPGGEFANSLGKHICLREGLYVVESAKTRSRLYHDIKKSLQPERLLVAPLAEEPKFKGMMAGALKALRGLSKT